MLGILGRRKDEPSVQPGAMFRRSDRSGVIEVAHVLSIGADRAGIPHVRFRVRKERPPRDTERGDLRTLALDTFRTHYPEKVEV